jgi:host factor-I protein
MVLRKTSMSETAPDVQREFLNALTANGRVVWVFLINGIKLSGTIAGVDTHVIFVRSPGGVLMVYKHAIATVCEPYTRLWSGQPSPSSSPREQRRSDRKPTV